MRLLPQFSSFRWIFTHSTCMMAVIRLPLDDDGPYSVLFLSLVFSVSFTFATAYTRSHFPFTFCFSFFFASYIVFPFSLSLKAMRYTVGCSMFDVDCMYSRVTCFIQKETYIHQMVHAFNAMCVWWIQDEGPISVELPEIHAKSMPNPIEGYSILSSASYHIETHNADRVFLVSKSG